eukprot:scaffold210262_cov38-Prasinocladus_malaysianus.AAC.1
MATEHRHPSGSGVGGGPSYIENQQAEAPTSSLQDDAAASYSNTCLNGGSPILSFIDGHDVDEQQAIAVVVPIGRRLQDLPATNDGIRADEAAATTSRAVMEGRRGGRRGGGRAGRGRPPKPAEGQS